MLAGVEASITGSFSFYYPSGNRDLQLADLSGYEQGIQGDAASQAGSYFAGHNIGFRSIMKPAGKGGGPPSPQWPIGTKQVYTGWSVGLSGGILPASASIYAGSAGYIYNSRVGWFPR